MRWALRFLGVGNAQAIELGSASSVIECDGKPELMIDCGQEALTAYMEHYRTTPDALFITHVHMDHVAGLERLFYKIYFDEAKRGKVRLYVPVTVLPFLQQRLAEYPGVIAEGGANWWDGFQLVPVSKGFWHNGFWYEVFPVRHHLPETAYALRLHGSMIWSGDTRPIPEMLAKHADANELIAHDCAWLGNPSHSGIEDLEREYSGALLQRCVLYHYESQSHGEQLVARGYKIAKPGELLALPAPTEIRMAQI
ncbi:MAG: MBL fold metallo-hydrolase [Arenimonas sp.]